MKIYVEWVNSSIWANLANLLPRTISQLNLLARGQQYELRARAKWNLYLIILCCCLVWMCSPAYTSSGYWQGGLKIPQDWRMHARVKGGYPPTCAGPLMWKQVKVWATILWGERCKIQGIVQMKSWPDPPLSSSKAVFDQEALLQSSLSLYPMHQKDWLNIYLMQLNPQINEISLNCLPVGKMDSVQWWFT